MSTVLHARVRAVLAVAAAALVLLPTVASAQPIQGSQRVAAIDDPVLASIALAQAFIDDGDADRVVLGRSDVFADNLGGAAVVGSRGVLLLVDPAPAPLRQEVLDEIERLFPPQETSDCDSEPTLGGEVLILGGANAIDLGVEEQILGIRACPTRLAGNNRVETSVAVAQYREGLSGDTSRGTLMIATAGNPADSAAASVFGNVNNSPIVVTGAASLDPAVRDLITPGDTAYEQIILLGGENALSAQVEADVIEAVGDSFDTTVRRIAGATRDDTALQVATELLDENFRSAATIVEGFAEDFWTYALPAAALSPMYSAPLLYVQTDSIPSTTDSFLRQFPVELLITVGPESRISEQTRTDAESSLGSAVTPGM